MTEAAPGIPQQRSAANRFLTPVLLGVWFGLVSGLLESVIRFGRKIISGEATHLGAYLAWMPAVSNAALLAGIGTGFAVAALIARPLRQPRLWLAVFGYLGALNVLWVWSPPLAMYAIMLLSVGIAFQLTRTAAARFDSFQRFIGRSVLVLLALVVVMAVGIEGWRAYRERRLADGPAATGRPNVLLLVLDTVRSFNLGAYGYFRDTSPTMVAQARRGVLFEHTIAVSSWTLPSHGAMFTGRWMHEQGTGWKDPLNDRWPTLAEELDKLGYTSGGFAGNLGYVDREYGLARGFAHYEDYEITWQQVLRSSRLGLWVSRIPQLDRRFGPVQEWTRKHAGGLTKDFLAWEARQKPDQPWFGFINFFDAHREYWSPREYRSMFTDDSARAPVVPRHHPPKNSGRRYGSQAPIEAYDRAIRYTDDEIGKLLAELERRGVLQNTLVIITSDHGEEFEEHGFVGHGNSLYLPALRIPLIMALPSRIPADLRVTQTVSNRDLAVTIMDLVGAREAAPFPGNSLARFWAPPPNPGADTVIAELGYAWGKPSWLPVSKGDMASAFDGTRHLIRGGDGQFELFDFGTDPWEQANFHSDSATHPRTTGLRAIIEALPEPDSTHRPPPNDAGHVAPGEE